MIAAAMLVACQAVAPDESARLKSDQRPQVTARWLSSCDAAARDAFFSLEFFDDGRVRYLGMQQARAMGERDTVIHRANARRILSAAKSYVSLPAKLPRPRNEAYYGRPNYYCLEVSVLDEGRVATARRLIEQADLHGGIPLLDRMIAKNAWVCPSRSSSVAQPLYYCLYRTDESIVTLYRHERDCAGYHYIALYPDGTLHYHALQFSAYVNGNRQARVAGEEYHAISKAAVRGVVQMVSGFQLPRSMGLGGELVAGFDGGTDLQVAELERRFRDLAPIDWVALQPPGGACSDNQHGIYFDPKN